MVLTAIIEMYIFNNLFKDSHTFTNRHTRFVEAVVFTAIIIEMYIFNNLFRDCKAFTYRHTGFVEAVVYLQL